MVLLIFLSVNCFAVDKNEWSASLGVFENSYDSGSNLTVSYTSIQPNYILRWNYFDINFFSLDVEGYHTEVLSNGNEVCREESTGQFSDSGNCSSIDTDMATSFEIGYVFHDMTLPLEINVGSRLLGDKDLGGESTVYVGLKLFSRGRLMFGEVRIASDYSLFSLGVNFNYLPMNYY